MNTRLFLFKVALALACVVPLNPWSVDLIGEANGATYYVSESGNDTWDGLAATYQGGINGPWRSPAAVTDHNADFDPNDQILFERGGTFRGQMILSNRTSLVIGAYGDPNDPKPIIKGSMDIDELVALYEIDPWDDLGDDLYRIQLPLGTTFVSHVYRGGTLEQIARFPNLDDPLYPGGWLHNGSGTGTIIDPDLPQADGYWVGAWVVVRSHNFYIQMAKVTSHQGDELVYVSNPAVKDLEGNDWGYFLVNKMEEIDQPGEWYYDPVANELYMMTEMGTGVPQGVEATVVGRGTRLQYCADMTIQDLTLMHFGEAGIRPESIDGLTIERCDFDHLVTAVQDQSVPQSDGLEVENCEFSNCYRYGLAANGTAIKVEDNEFMDIGREPGLGGLPPMVGSNNDQVQGNEYGAYSAIACDLVGENGLIRGSTIDRVGNNGISASGGGLVERNYVSNAEYVMNDGAAITFDECNKLVVRLNIVRDVLGNLDGAATSGGNAQRKGVGIYFGYSSNTNTTVEENVVTACSDGIVVDHEPGCEGNVVARNTVFSCNGSQIFMQDLGLLNFDTYQAQYDDVIQGNILYCLRSDQVCLYQSQTKAQSFSGTRPLVDFGTFADNYYFNPFNQVSHVQYVRYAPSDFPTFLDPDGRNIPWTLSGWQNQTGAPDAESSRSPLRLLDHAASNAVLVTEISDECDDIPNNPRGGR